MAHWHVRAPRTAFFKYNSNNSFLIYDDKNDIAKKAAARVQSLVRKVRARVAGCCHRPLRLRFWPVTAHMCSLIGIMWRVVSKSVTASTLIIIGYIERCAYKLSDLRVSHCLDTVLEHADGTKNHKN